MSKLKGKTAVITGASSGIGRAIALALGRAGATLQLVGRNTATLEEVIRTSQTGGNAYEGDLESVEGLTDVARQIGAKCGSVDVLVHSAGSFAMGTIESAPAAVLDAMYRVNVRAPFVLTQALLPPIRAACGQVFFINSTAGFMDGRSGVAHYAMTKHALRALADSLRDELNGQGVRVVSIYPGRTASPMQAAVHAEEGRPYRPELLMQPEDVASALLNVIDLPRTTDITEIRMRPASRG